MFTLPLARRAAIVRGLVEGQSVRAVARVTGASKNTVLRLLGDVGEFCSVYQDHALRRLPTRRVKADEIWAFCGTKQRNATRHGQGDIWTFTAIDADSKLMLLWLVGERTPENAYAFMQDVAGRLANRVQFTTDGHHMYLTAVEGAFSYHGVDYAMLVKTYGLSVEAVPQRGYSLMVCTGATKERVLGNPGEDLVSTSYVERADLTMRMQMRRFTRLTNAFSKKAENHAHAVSLRFMAYNYCRPHGTLTKAAKGVKTTPAMAAGVSDRVYTVEDVLARMDPDRPLQ